MNHAEKIEWMHRWASRHGMTLTLEGECGFGRKCVGVLHSGNYPDYEDWGFNGPSWSENFPPVWRPSDAYHKHPCVAVLGHGEAAEEQLYQWLKWFDDHNYRLETGTVDLSGKSDIEKNIAIMMNQHVYYRLVPAVAVAETVNTAKPKIKKKAAKKRGIKKCESSLIVPSKKK
jgi:hypothetical protein